MEVPGLNPVAHRTTLWCLSFRNKFINSWYFPQIPKRFSLYIGPSCQNLLKAFDKSRNTPLTSNEGFASNAL